MTSARPSRWTTALFALAFAVAGVIQAVYVFSGEDTYRALVLAEEPAALSVTLPSGETWIFQREGLVILHRGTTAYVMGNAPRLPDGPIGKAFYAPDEVSHLNDVRSVFAAVRVAWAAALLLLAALVIRGSRSRYLARLVRDGALASAAAVIVIAVVAAFAFEPAFLAFHYLFFPQGNFLFDPVTSNMLQVYPERYWYGVTLRVGIAFIVAALVTATVAALRSRGRSAIVPAR